MIISRRCRNTPCQIQSGCSRRLCRRWAVATSSLHYSKIKIQKTTTGVFMNRSILSRTVRHNNVKAPTAARTPCPRTAESAWTSRPCRRQRGEPNPRATRLKTHLFEKGTIAADEINVKLLCGPDVKSIALTTLTGGSGSYRASPTCDPYHHIIGSGPTVNSQTLMPSTSSLLSIPYTGRPP